jgi:hypothetical protein
MNYTEKLFKILSYAACLVGIIETSGYSEISGETLPWQSMPEGFVRKKIKNVPQEKSPYTWNQNEIDQLREDNNELRDRLRESLVVREELYQTQKALLINLEMELARTGILRQSLQKAMQKWESYKNKLQDIAKEESTSAQELEQYKEMLKVKEREFQTKIEKLKQEIRILGEAFATNQKVLNEFKQQQTVESSLSKASFTSKDEEAIALGEDLDLEELDKAEKNKKISDESKEEREEIIFISENSSQKNNCEPDWEASKEIVYLDRDEETIPRIDLEQQEEKRQKDLSNLTKEASDGEMIYVTCVEKGRFPFYISSKKVTNQEYQQFISSINYKRPIHWPKGHLPLELENKPLVNVTYEDAFLYSVWLGKRLPSQDELLCAEQAGVLVDVEDDINEWTATPEIKRGTHRLFSPQNKAEGVLALPNSTFNTKTGFRIASDSN